MFLFGFAMNALDNISAGQLDGFRAAAAAILGAKDKAIEVEIERKKLEEVPYGEEG